MRIFQEESAFSSAVSGLDSQKEFSVDLSLDNEGAPHQNILVEGDNFWCDGVDVGVQFKSVDATDPSFLNKLAFKGVGQWGAIQGPGCYYSGSLEITFSETVQAVGLFTLGLFKCEVLLDSAQEGGRHLVFSYAEGFFGITHAEGIQKIHLKTFDVGWIIRDTVAGFTL